MNRYNASETGLLHPSSNGDLCLWEDVEQLETDNERLKDRLIEERLPNFCTGIECGCAERVVEARKKARIKLRQELAQALKGENGS